MVQRRALVEISRHAYEWCVDLFGAIRARDMFSVGVDSLARLSTRRIVGRSRTASSTSSTRSSQSSDYASSSSSSSSEEDVSVYDSWLCVSHKCTVYVRLPSTIDGIVSHSQIRSLLEMAEEVMKGKNVVICIDRQMKMNIQSQLRMLLYVGFQLFRPTTNATNTAASNNWIFVGYDL